MPDKPPENAVHSIERALAIIETLGRHPQGLGVTELGQEVGLHKSTVHRLLGTLVAYGYVEQDSATERYRLGMKMVVLGLELLDRIDFRKEALPYLKELVDFSHESVSLAVLDHGEVVYIEQDHSPEAITVNLGIRGKVHCTAAGKVLLAYLPREEAVSILNRQEMHQYTVNTITEVDFMLTHLEKVRSQGYAISAEELVEGLRLVAAPVFNHQGKVVAAVSVAGPTSRLSLERIARLVAVLRETCTAISARLGYRGGESRLS